MVQGELFRDESGDWQGKGKISFLSSRQWLMSLDKVILMAVACVILFVLTYSFGYERGKSLMERRIRELTTQIETIPSVSPAAPVTTSVGTLQVGVQKTQVDTIAVSEIQPNIEDMSHLLAEEPSESVPTEIENGKYTVQVATSLKKELAEREISKLEKKGFSAFVVNRGRFFEVCVGSFETVANARPVLSQLKAQGSYLDAFVRPLSKP